MCFYRRILPHWQLGQAKYFITFRLAVSLLPGAIERLKSLQYYLENTNLDPSLKQSRMFAKYETLLDGLSIGPTWLKNESIAKIVCEVFHYRDQNEYDLCAYCVMPNHVHLVFKLQEENKSDDKNDFPVTKMLQELKRYTAVESNRILKIKGQFWQHESYDRVICNGQEHENTIRYVINNPVKAGLTDHWENWSHSYCKPEYIDTFRENM